MDYLSVLDDPTPQRLQQYIRDGQIRTWQACSMIKNRWKIEERLTKFKQLCFDGNNMEDL
jgi:hypothetical protein